MKCMMRLTVKLEPEGQETFIREMELPCLPQPGMAVLIHEMFETKVEENYLDICEGEATLVVVLEDIVEGDIPDCIKKMYSIQETLHLAGWQ